jgi:hypothetical protein
MCEHNWTLFSVFPHPICVSATGFRCIRIRALFFPISVGLKMLIRCRTYSDSLSDRLLQLQLHRALARANG